MIKPLSRPTNLTTFVIFALLTQKHILKRQKTVTKKPKSTLAVEIDVREKKELRKINFQDLEKIQTLVLNTAKNCNYPIKAYFKNT